MVSFKWCLSPGLRLVLDSVSSDKTEEARGGQRQPTPIAPLHCWAVHSISEQKSAKWNQENQWNCWALHFVAWRSFRVSCDDDDYDSCFGVTTQQLKRNTSGWTQPAFAERLQSSLNWMHAYKIFFICFMSQYLTGLERWRQMLKDIQEGVSIHSWSVRFLVRVTLIMSMLLKKNSFTELWFMKTEQLHQFWSAQAAESVKHLIAPSYSIP